MRFRISSIGASAFLFLTILGMVPNSYQWIGVGPDNQQAFGPGQAASS